jgi:hypothetical protein
VIDLNKLFEIIKKQGATGVLAIWLYYTHNEVQDLKVRLYECYGKTEQVFEKELDKEASFIVIPKDELNEKLKNLIA